MSPNISKRDRVLLISEVESRPAIWNDADPNHKNTSWIEKQWHEIADTMKGNPRVLKGKWKHLRAKMRKELIKMISSKDGTNWKSTWEFFDMMLFVKDVILSSPLEDSLLPAIAYRSTLQDSDGTPEECEYTRQSASPSSSVLSSLSTPVVTPGGQAQVKIKLREDNGEATEEKRVRIFRETAEFDKNLLQNPDYNFLVSLLPFIEPLTLLEKLDLRERIEREVNIAYKQHVQMFQHGE